ncbi:MAG TPA: glycosyltransferase [Candidatus Saccharibacteria bacterium]|nr:glycosyltransferase [Candidatus Saccharibacteria bacterium]
MTILLVGGGSGGHITPVLAIAESLKKKAPKAKLIFLGAKGDVLADIPKQRSVIDRFYSIRAGKFRRYHQDGLKQLLDIPTLLKNIRDVVYVCIGFFQSFWILYRTKPDVIFIKGGFVGVPVGLAAALQKIPYITHDSDVVPGLANRLIGRWAKIHTVALPEKYYRYPAKSTVTVGVPVAEQYRPVSPQQLAAYRESLHIPKSAQYVICLTGGGNGSSLLNDALVAIAEQLLERYPELWIIHITGRGKLEAATSKYKQGLNKQQQSRVILKDFVTDLYRYSGASDLIIMRAGATSLADFAAQAKACLVIPNPLLTGGHQLKNAQVLQANKAVVVVDEAVISAVKGGAVLFNAICELLDNTQARKHLATTLHEQMVANASDNLAELLINDVLQKR